MIRFLVKLITLKIYMCIECNKNVWKSKKKYKLKDKLRIQMKKQY